MAGLFCARARLLQFVTGANRRGWTGHILLGSHPLSMSPDTNGTPCPPTPMSPDEPSDGLFSLAMAIVRNAHQLGNDSPFEAIPIEWNVSRSTGSTACNTTPAEPDAQLVLELAAIIREVDGSNYMGAAALAEAILSHPRIESTGLIPQPMALQWTENLPPCEECRYDHCIATTPLGRYVIEWKSWKEFGCKRIAEVPWNTRVVEPESIIYRAFNDLDEAKKACQAEFNKRLLSCCAATAKQEPNNEAL